MYKRLRVPPPRDNDIYIYIYNNRSFHLEYYYACDPIARQSAAAALTDSRRTRNMTMIFRDRGPDVALSGVRDAPEADWKRPDSLGAFKQHNASINYYLLLI